MNYEEPDAVKELAASLEEMLKDEPRWRIVSHINCLPHDLPFMFMQPEGHAWKFYMRSDVDDVEIDYENRVFGNPRLRFKGKLIINPDRLGQTLYKTFSTYAHPLHEKLYWKYRHDWKQREAVDALNPPSLNPVGWWRKLKGALVAHM